MKELIEELYLTNRGFVTTDYQECLKYIDEHKLSLDYRKFKSGREIWDSWIVPKKWMVNHAYVKADGTKILSFSDHPLHLISYSDSYEGWISRKELIKHIHTHPDNPEAIPWHFRLNYRPWDSEWGFCASQEFVDSLNRDEYYVSIDTRFQDDEMVVAEHHLPGKRDDTIVLMAHLDHTGMANDDLSGVAVGIEIIRRLQELPERRYSYKFLIVQELIGSAAYLEEFTKQASDFVYGIFLEMLGNDNRLLLQRSFNGNSKLDAVAERVLKTSVSEFDTDGFRAQIGNDELILESPGYEIPTISLLRGPYPEYHTHLDNPSIIHEERLKEAVSYVLDVIDILEKDFIPIRNFQGLPSLANPKYDLYLDPKTLPDVEVGKEGKLDSFRDRIFRHLDSRQSVFDIAQHFGLQFDFVYSYLQRFEKKDLIQSKPPVEY
jgi:aminopeptidase-like protein